MTKPILVVMSWRGEARLERCLKSIIPAADAFERIVISVTAPADSPDNALARDFTDRVSHAEALCTGSELPTMQHQAFWVDHLEATGVRPDQWIYWLAYDDEIRWRGIEILLDESGGWKLTPRTAYVGPWAMRHERPDELFNGDPTAPLESWTSFPPQGPRRLPVMTWIADQLRQPTYMQMSGSVMPFSSYLALRDDRPRKQGPMRIEMAAASARGIDVVEEFPEPVSIIYGRSDSDRASYGSAARREDVHLALWLTRRSLQHPSEFMKLATAGSAVARTYADAVFRRTSLPEEEWRVRGAVLP